MSATTAGWLSAYDASLLRFSKSPGRSLVKAILIIIGLALIALGVVYLLVPADSLPAFLPGHEAGLARPRMKHGLLSGAVGVLALAASFWVGRK